MEVSPEHTESVVKRLRRAQGQIGGVIRMVEEGRNCEDIITQVAAVSKAIDRAGFALIAAEIKECIDKGDFTDVEKLEHAFLSLA